MRIKRFCITAVFLMYGFLASAQVEYSAIWIDYTHKNKLTDKWKAVSDYGYRVRFGYINNYHRVHARTGFGYKVAKKASVWAGAAVFGVSSPNFMSAIELRPWQGFKLKGPKFGKFTVKHFVRLEERFQFYNSSNTISYSHFTLKLRYMLEVDYAFNHPENDKGKWEAFASFEPFINLYSSSKLVEVTTSRSIIGVSYHWSKKTKFNALYCYQTGNIPFLEGTSIYDNIVRLSVIQSF